MNNVEVKILYPNNDEVEHMQKILCTAWDYAKTTKPLYEIEDSLGSGTYNPVDRFTEILKQRLPLTWFQNFVIAIGGVPRAFMDQIDRHQMPKFWQQSFRVLNLTQFADKGDYWDPQYNNGAEVLDGTLDYFLTLAESNGVNDTFYKDEAKKAISSAIYNKYFSLMQRVYNALLKVGMPSEQARGVMGLHVNTRTSMVCSWEALRHMISSRTCFIAQGEYWQPVIAGIISELERIGFPEELIRSLVKPPCMITGQCPYEGNMLERMRDDPNDVCPLYIQKYSSNDASVVRAYKDMKNRSEMLEFSLKKNPQYAQVAETYGKSVGVDLKNELGL